VENINFLGKAITLHSSEGAELTTLNGSKSSSVVIFNNNEGPDSIIEGFTIRNGLGIELSYGTYAGGGVYCENASPVVRGNIIKSNHIMGVGGGIYCSDHADSQIIDNLIKNNKASWRGAGIYCANSSPTIQNNLIALNGTSEDPDQGGGIYCVGDSAPKITNNIISENKAFMGAGIQCENENCQAYIAYNFIQGNIAYHDGGGINCYWDAMPTLNGNILLENIASRGGGICCGCASPLILNNIIYGNFAQSYEGGGICCIGSFTSITNNTIIENTAGTGIGKGGGIYGADSALLVTNTILRRNNASIGSEICVSKLIMGYSTITISWSDVEGGINSCYVDTGCTLNWGDGMIDADPCFADPENRDLHLLYPSPCRNTGDNAAVVDSDDFEGDPRIAGGIVDMGADEFYNHFYCTGDFTPNGTIEGKIVGLPDTWPVGLFIGSGIMDPPLQHKWGEFYLESPWLLFPLVPIPSNGVLEIPATLPATPAPYDIPMHALIGWELSNLFVLEVR